MRPTKRTQATKKERGTKGNPVLSKLLKLKYRINDTAKTENGFSKDMGSHKSWVIEEISNLRNDGWLTATKMKVANEMWSKYGG